MASVKKRTGYGYEVRYVDPATGRRPSKTFELKKDADAYKRKVEREIEDGLHTAEKDGKTVAAAALEFIGHYDQRVKDGTIGETRAISIEQFSRRHIVPVIGGLRLSHLTFADVERLRASLVAKGLSPVSVKHVMGVMRQLEDFGKRRGYTKRSTVREVMREAPAARGRPVAVPSPSEMRRIVEAALTKAPGHSARSDAFMAIMTITASICGLRYGELTALRLVDVDVDGRVLQVRQSVTRLGLIKGPKSSAGVRDVPMPAHLAELFRAWIERFYVVNPEQLVLTTWNGRPPKGSSFQSTYWAPLLRRAGLPHVAGERFRFHSLRHFAASMMIQHNMPLTEVASVLGHSKFDMTLQVYAHPIVGGTRRADVIERIGMTHDSRAHDAPVTQTLLSA